MPIKSPLFKILHWVISPRQRKMILVSLQRNLKTNGVAVHAEEKDLSARKSRTQACRTCWREPRRSPAPSTIRLGYPSPQILGGEP